MHGTMERDPLLQVATDVVPFRREHVWSASHTWVKGFMGDPQMQYIRMTSTPSSFMNAVDHFAMAGIMYLSIPRSVALCIKDGAGFLLMRPPYPDNAADPEYQRQGFWTSVRGATISTLASIVYRRYGSPEQRRRSLETDRQLHQAIHFVLGKRSQEMFCLNMIGVLPEEQGHGYGGKLLNAATNLADLANQGIWLTSSNSKNISFYEAHGFEVLVEVGIGKDNNSWHDSPIPIAVMVREPKPVVPAQYGAISQ